MRFPGVTTAAAAGLAAASNHRRLVFRRCPPGFWQAQLSGRMSARQWQSFTNWYTGTRSRSLCDSPACFCARNVNVNSENDLRRVLRLCISLYKRQSRTMASALLCVHFDGWSDLLPSGNVIRSAVIAGRQTT